MSMRKFFVWPSSYEPPKDTDLLSDLDRQMNAVLRQRSLSDDIKMTLYQSTMRRWMAARDAKQQQPLMIGELAAAPPPPPGPPAGRLPPPEGRPLATPLSPGANSVFATPPSVRASEHASVHTARAPTSAHASVPSPASVHSLDAASPGALVATSPNEHMMLDASTSTAASDDVLDYSMRTARAPSASPGALVATSPVVTPLQQPKKHTSRKNYAVASLDEVLQRIIQWDNQGRIEMGQHKVPNSDIRHIIDYLSEVQPEQREPVGTDMVIEAMAISTISPDLVINRDAKKKLRDLIGARGSPVHTRSHARFVEQD